MENPTIFEGKTFEGLLKDIYDNSVAKKASIQTLKDTLTNLINTAQDAATIVPLVKDIIEVEVKNDEHLVKMATIIQRLISSKVKDSGSGLEGLLTEQEKQELLDDLDAALQANDDVEKLRIKASNVLEVKDAKTDS